MLSTALTVSAVTNLIIDDNWQTLVCALEKSTENELTRSRIMRVSSKPKGRGSILKQIKKASL